jgi:hypothetical protein
MFAGRLRGSISSETGEILRPENVKDFILALVDELARGGVTKARVRGTIRAWRRL